MFELDIVSIETVANGNHFSKMRDVVLSKGLRIEKYYSGIAFKITMKCESILQPILRMWWEENKLYNTKKSYISNVDKHEFRMYMSLGEALDYIYTVTPPLLQSEIPESTKTLESIRQVLTTYLTEKHGGLEKFYLSKFQEMSMLYREQDVTALTSDILLRVNSICDKVTEGTIAYIIHSNKTIQQLTIEEDKRGLYVFHCWNRGDVQTLFEILDSYPGYHVMDYHHDMNHGHYITIYLDEWYEDTTVSEDDIKTLKKLDAIIERSYAWLNSAKA